MNQKSNNGATAIPIPLKQRWNDFRSKHVPVLTFMCLVGTIGLMWSRYVNPSIYVGQAEAIHAQLTTTLPGIVQDLKIDRLESVTNGQCLAVINVIEPEVLAEELSAIATELRLLKVRVDVDKTRNLQGLASMRHDLLTERLDLSIAQVRLEQAESELARTRKLYEDKLISAAGTKDIIGYDLALCNRDALQAEIKTRTKVIEQSEADLHQVESTGVVTIDPLDDTIEKDIAAQQKRFQTINRPLLLRSPIDGFVSLINRRDGERVVAGESILVVSAAHTDRVVGWVRQPLTTKPNVGDVVQLRRADLGQRVIEATITQVGAQLEPIDPELRLSADPRIELGLPFLVDLPKDSHFIPGQMIEISPVRRSKGTAN
jgi:multidrug resistance efflux pump